MRKRLPASCSLNVHTYLQGYLIRNTQYVIRNTQYFTVLAKQQQYSGQKYVDLKLVRFQTV